MPYFTKYYEFDAFFSHCTSDEGVYEKLFSGFEKALCADLKTSFNIAQARISRDPNVDVPVIHAYSRAVDHLFVAGDLQKLYNNASNSFIFVAFIGYNYLFTVACLKEMLGFLESKRDSEALKSSLFLGFCQGVNPAMLFNLANNPVLVQQRSQLHDENRRTQLEELWLKISKKLNELYRNDPNSLIPAFIVPKFNPHGDDESDVMARRHARRFARAILDELQNSSVLVDPARADDDFCEGRAFPFVVLQSTDGSRENDELADPQEALAIGALEQLSQAAQENRPLKAYPVSTEKLTAYADGNIKVSPFDPRLPWAPMGFVMMARKATGAFSAPSNTVFSKLRSALSKLSPNNVGTLQISTKSSPPDGGARFIANGERLFEPQENAQDFVRRVQSRYP